MKSKLMLLVLCLSSFCAVAQMGDESNVNPLNVARALALKTPAYFEGQLNGRVPVGESWQWITMKFTVRKSDFAITNLVVNGEQIPLPEPIYGLPLGEAGIMENANFNVTARTSARAYAGNGYLQKGILSKNERVLVTIRPDDVELVLPVDMSQLSGCGVELEIINFTFGYGYGTEDDGFLHVYLPPIGGAFKYIARSRCDNTVLGTGIIEPYKNPLTPDDSYFGVRYPGNVVGVEFEDRAGEDWLALQTEFDSTIPMSTGQSAKGKVLFVDAGTGGLEVVVEGDATVYVYQATGAIGDMPTHQLVDISFRGSDWIQTRFYTATRNIGRAVVVIIPKEAGKTQSWINLHRYYVTPTNNVK